MIKNIYLRVFPLLLFLCFVHVLPGQNGDSVPHYMHRFSWEESEYALRYEVIIEQEENGRYQNLLREFTDTFFIDFALPPGDYRMRVIPHDLRDIPVGETEWRSFQVLAPMPEPVVQIEEPEELVIDPVIQIDELEIITQTEEPEQEAEPEIIVQVEEPVIDPVIHIDESEQEVEPIEKRVKKDLPFNMFASAAWMPFIPLYEGEGDIFDNTLSFVGAAIRFGMIHDKDFFNLYPGLELAGSWYSAEGENTISATINFLAHKRHLNEVTTVTFRFGVGYTLLSGRETQGSAAQLIHTNLGVSFRWLAFEPFFFEAGFDYTHYFTNRASGCLRPWIGFGIRL